MVELDLSDNRMDDACVAMLARLLRHDIALRQLKLDTCQMREGRLLHILQSMPGEAGSLVRVDGQCHWAVLLVSVTSQCCWSVSLHCCWSMLLVSVTSQCCWSVSLVNVAWSVSVVTFVDQSHWSVSLVSVNSVICQ